MEPSSSTFCRLCTWVFLDSLFSWNTHFFASSYFRHPTRPGSSTTGPARPIENWVLCQPTSSLDVPDLQAIAKDLDLGATLVMYRLACNVRGIRNSLIKFAVWARGISI